MSWLLIGVLIWVAIAVPAALVIARGIRLADAHRAAESEALTQEPNFVASDVPPADAALHWTGPATVPFPPPPPRQRRRPSIIRHHPVQPAERDQSTQDSGLL